MMQAQTKSFYRSLWIIVLPIVLQNLINTAVGSADVIMLGYVGQSALAAASLANQIQFVLNLFYAGLVSGMTMLAAQYWGKGDMDTIENIFGIGLAISMAVTVIFSVLACFFPQFLMRIFTKDAELIELGCVYLRIIGISYLFMGVSQSYLSIIKSIERVKTSTAISCFALVTNIFLNAVLIFGLFGAPKLGVAGVAIATTISRILELLLCVLDNARHHTITLHPGKIFRRNILLAKDFIRYSLPAMGNEFIWGLAFSMYTVIMGHLGSDVVAANSVVTVARNMGTIVCFGIAGGGTILLGKSIGCGRLEEARENASRLCRVTFVTGVAGGLLILLLKPFLMNMADLTETATSYLNIMLYINSFYVLGQAMNTTIICGVFRSGGDSKFGFFCDIIDMWLVSVPLGFLCAFVFKLPVMTVYFILCMDEFIKMPFVFRHYKSYKWLKNITR